MPHLVAKRLHGQGLGVKVWGFRVGGLGFVLSENSLFSGSTWVFGFRKVCFYNLSIVLHEKRCSVLSVL